MSLSFLSSLNKPPLVTAAGAVMVAGLPWMTSTVSTMLPLGVLQVANIIAFGINMAAVSVPGRIDSNQDFKMRQGDLNPTTEGTRLVPPADNHDNTTNPLVLREKSLVKPAGWAFSIWGPIYLGEAIFCVAQFIPATNLTSSIVQQASIPFVAANLLQSLWCASFRSTYTEEWHKYVSVAMLGGTAFSLSYIPADLSWFFLPMVLHFGWTSAATLVNLNSSLAMEGTFSDSSLVAFGHASAVVATGLGVGLTVYEVSTPAYGLTLAWALAGVASGVKWNTASSSGNENDNDWSNAMQTGARVQRALCWMGSVLCAAAAAFTIIM